MPISTNPHVISPAESEALIKKFADNKEAILNGYFQNQQIFSNSESFDKESIELLLASYPEYAGLRIYLGMDEENKIRFVVKLTDDKNQDVNDIILERGLTP